MTRKSLIEGGANISLFILMFLVTALPLIFPYRNELLQSGLFFSLSLIVQFLVIMPFYLLFFRKREAFNAGRPTLIQFATLFLLIMTIQLAIPYLFFSHEGERVSDWTYNLSILAVIMTQLSIVILAPIYEEIVYRGGLFGGLTLIFKSKLFAALFTSIIFTFMHTQYSEFQDLFIMFIISLVLIAAKLISRGLYLPILLHIAMNFVAVNGFLFSAFK